MLISQSFFTGGLRIPGLTGVGIVPQANLANLNWFINTYEPAYLKKVLGETLYTAFMAGIAENPVAQKWIDLRSKLVDSINYLSPIASYVYYFVESDRITITTIQGEAKGSTENGEIVINTQKMRSAYNDSMVKGREVRQWIYENISTYTEYTESELAELNKLTWL